MGSGTSKGTVQVVAADTARVSSVQNNNIAEVKNTNEENHGEASQPAETQNEDMEDRRTSGNYNVKTVAVGEALGKLKENIAATIEDQNTRGQDVAEDESSVMLTSFIEKNPKLEEALRKIRDHYQGLKDAFTSGNLVTTETHEHIKGLFTVYTDHHKPEKAVLTDLAVCLGLPKLAYDIIVDRKTNCPELTTWDREIETERKSEGNETSATTENQVK